MPLYLVPPGKRKNNKSYLVRGEVGGRSIEVSAKTTDEASAYRFALALELKLLEDSPPASDERIDFAQAAKLYKAWRDPRVVDVKRIDKLVAILGKKLLAEISLDDLHRAAIDLHPSGAPATRNREVMRPAASILHHAADAKRCEYMRVKLFKEPRPKTKGVSQEIAKALIRSLPDEPIFERTYSDEFLELAAKRHRKKALLLLWLFRQGHRISDALSIKVEDIDRKRWTVTRHIGKTDEEVIESLHDEVVEELMNDPPEPGFLFPWRTKSGVYKWLRPYTKKLGIKFTPHMARHSLGKWLNEDGASLRTIMDTLHHADPKSSARYQSTEMEIVRARGNKLGKLLGNKDRK